MTRYAFDWNTLGHIEGILEAAYDLHLSKSLEEIKPENVHTPHRILELYHTLSPSFIVRVLSDSTHKPTARLLNWLADLEETWRRPRH